MDRPEFASRLKELAELVRQVPPGRCASYGSLGRAMTRPVSGFLAGKWMASLEGGPAEPPWWRIVKKDGTLATFDRDPQIGLEQRRRLEAEGVAFEEDRVRMADVGWDEFDSGPTE